MSKYDPLARYLKELPASRQEITLAFEDIEDKDKIGVELPSSAKQYRPWWGNEARSSGRQCRAWLDAGWKVEDVHLQRETVTFRRCGHAQTASR